MTFAAEIEQFVAFVRRVYLHRGSMIVHIHHLPTQHLAQHALNMKCEALSCTGSCVHDGAGAERWIHSLGGFFQPLVACTLCLEILAGCLLRASCSSIPKSETREVHRIARPMPHVREILVSLVLVEKCTVVGPWQRAGFQLSWLGGLRGRGILASGRFEISDRS